MTRRSDPVKRDEWFWMRDSKVIGDHILFGSSILQDSLHVNKIMQDILHRCGRRCTRTCRPGGLCCTNPVRDSSRESSVVAEVYEQTHTPELQDPELAEL